MKNSIGKPCEGKLHARFDVGGTDSLFKIIIFMDIKYCVGCQTLLYPTIIKHREHTHEKTFNYSITSIYNNF